MGGARRKQPLFIDQLLAVSFIITSVRRKNISSSKEKTMTIIKADFGKAPSPKKAIKEQERSIPVYQLHVSLAFSEPLIWRRLLVPGKMTLKQLHRVLQICMDWTGEYGHQFYVGKVFYHDNSSGERRFYEAAVSLHDIEEAMRWCFSYIYDAGDGWEFNLELEEILPAKNPYTHPRAIDGQWAAPNETGPGTFGHVEPQQARENIGRNSRVITEKSEPMEDGGHFFDLGAVNARLQNDATLSITS